MDRLKSLTMNAILKRLVLLDTTEKTICFDQIPLPPVLIFQLRRKLAAAEEWLKQHHLLIPDPKRFVDELTWYEGANESDPLIDRWNTLLRILRRRKSQLKPCERFELSAMYCLKEETLSVWPELSQQEQQKYLAERVQQHDPIVIFWTGICARQPWLSDSYVVRAFYWAAEHDYLEALEYFWEHIVQERADAVTFRAVRAFQLAACKSHLQALLFLWRQTDDEQHRLMIQGTLTYTQGALYAFESACKDGQYELVKFIFQEADHQQLVVILRAEECRAFRLAAENGHVDVLRLFLERAQRMKLKRHLLEAENCYAFRRALTNGHDDVVELIWSHADSDDDRRILLNAALFSGDIKETKNVSVIDFLWKNTSIDMRSAIFSDYIVPNLAKEFYTEYGQSKEPSCNSALDSVSPVTSSTSIVPITLNDLCIAGESTFFAICAMPDVEQVQNYVKDVLTTKYCDRRNNRLEEQLNFTY